MSNAAYAGTLDGVSIQKSEGTALKKENIYLSTIASDAVHIAREYGLGLEIAEYCTAWNMDEKFDEVHPKVREEITGIPKRILHAPFNELFPCAIDKKARALAAQRYRQAIELAKAYGATKVVIHGGYNPWIYYPVWYVEESVKFWKEFLQEDPGVQIVLENVLRYMTLSFSESENRVSSGFDDTENSDSKSSSMIIRPFLDAQRI